MVQQLKGVVCVYVQSLWAVSLRPWWRSPRPTAAPSPALCPIRPAPWSPMRRSKRKTPEPASSTPAPRRPPAITRSPNCPRAYQVNVTVPGFKKYSRAGLTVEVAQTLRIDISLEVGSASESITVNGSAPLLKTESGELSHNVDIKPWMTLPILGIGGTLVWKCRHSQSEQHGDGDPGRQLLCPMP